MKSFAPLLLLVSCVTAFRDMLYSEPPNKSLATGAAALVLDGEGDSLLLGFVVASFPTPVPELGR